MTTQQEFFKKATTDHLLSIRYNTYCQYPQQENDKPDFTGDSGNLYYINKNWLYEELGKRPNRVRAKDRRKKK